MSSGVESGGPAPVVLVIDDEAQIRRLLRVILEGHGYQVFDAVNGGEGILMAAQRRPEVVILDLGLPDLDGVEVIRRIREWSQVPILVLSVRDREEDKVSALDAGADDYVTKPFGAGEVLARMRVALRRQQAGTMAGVIRSGAVELDLVARTVRRAGEEVHLTPTEYALVRMLASHAGRVVTHRQLLSAVWGPKAVEATHYLRVHIAHLREKLEEDSSQPRVIVTEPGVGYRWIEREPENGRG